MKKISMLLGAVLLSIGGMLYAVEYGGERTYLSEIPYKVCPVAPLPKEAKEKGIIIASIDKAVTLYKEGAFFYDARRKAHYDEGHIKGAKPVLFDVSKASYTVLDLPKDDKTPLVFYCYGVTCANSYEAALAVKEYGYKNVYWFSVGYAAWQEKNQPTER